ncbi:hypothetical protein NDU88_003191 [Pleurodeles waltl]|uniref:Uncharacterized protein n=1 Tax=Pleurodeles waltl TaxID=8319 RepID=A0AAV7UBU6_PLEWA|nr:hypothetical protein NDU88_003191 [Pleurodeles waltl]
MRSPVAAAAGSHRNARVPQLPGPGVPRAKLCQSAALLTAPRLSLPATSQQCSSSSAAQPENSRAGGRSLIGPPIGPPARPTANRRPQRPRPQEQSAPSPRRAHKAAERRTTRAATPTSRPRGAQTPRMRWQPQAQRGKNRGGPRSELTAAQAPAYSPGKMATQRRLLTSPGAAQAGASPRLFSPPHHKADRLRRLCPQRRRQYPATSAAVGRHQLKAHPRCTITQPAPS